MEPIEDDGFKMDSVGEIFKKTMGVQKNSVDSIKVTEDEEEEKGPKTYAKFKNYKSVFENLTK